MNQKYGNVFEGDFQVVDKRIMKRTNCNQISFRMDEDSSSMANLCVSPGEFHLASIGKILHLKILKSEYGVSVLSYAVNY